MAKQSGKKTDSKSTDANVKTESAHNYSGYTLSKAMQRLVDNKQKFRWRGVTYNAASLSKKQLEFLAGQNRFRDISKG